MVPPKDASPPRSLLRTISKRENCQADITVAWPLYLRKMVWRDCRGNRLRLIAAGFLWGRPERWLPPGQLTTGPHTQAAQGFKLATSAFSPVGRGPTKEGAFTFSNYQSEYGRLSINQKSRNWHSQASGEEIKEIKLQLSSMGAG